MRGNELVTEAQVQTALDFLRDSADDLGKAKGEAVKAEAMLRHTKAIVMKLHIEMPVGAQEREAYASDLYLEQIEAHAEAAAAYETLKARRESALTDIEAWRSAGANYRAMKL